MFERYTERARRVIFFARYEASQFGSTTIETEYFLLGLIREDKNLMNLFLLQHSSIESIRKEIEGRTWIREKVSTSIDLPLSNECKRILAYAAYESDRLNHQHIGTEHLLLGILREEKCMAAQVLSERGLKLEAVRKQFAGTPSPEVPRDVITTDPLSPLFSFSQHHPSVPESGLVPDADTAKRIAEAIWIPLYGAETVARQTPLRADLKSYVWLLTEEEKRMEGKELKSKVWLVTGAQVQEGALFVFILQTDGRIVLVGRETPNSGDYRRFLRI